MAQSIHDFTMTLNDGAGRSLAEYAGKVLLVVNTASKCGLTKQYSGLEELHRTYRDRGFEVLAFPSNDFGGQEPGTDGEIRQFCSTRFATTFDLFSKTPTLGEGAHPLYQFLTSQPGASGDIEWNFAKFLINGEGKVVARFDPGVEPMAPALIAAIETELAAGTR